MKKNTFFTALILILTLILGACGQSATNDNGNNNSNADGQIEENDSQENDADKNDAENNDVSEEDANEEETEDQGTDGAEDSEEDESNQDDNASDESGQAMDRTNSDEQNYSIALLPNYTLTSEEPGKDSLYLTEDGTVFMRIETEQSNAETYDYFKDNLVSLLEATSENGAQPTELTAAELPTGEQLENAVGYQVNTVEGVTTGYVFNSGELTVRLTVFDTLDQTYLPDFIQMGQTIQAQ